MTQSSSDGDREELPTDSDEAFLSFVESVRRRPPRKGLPHKTFAELATEQGVGPIDIEDLMSKSPGPLYEGFEEDIRRMRRGQQPIGPRK